MPEAALDLDTGDTGVLLLDVIARVKEGDFSARMPLDWTGVPGKVADGLNDVIMANQSLEREFARMSELGGTQGHHLDRAAALRGALDNHEIEAHYQPIVELDTGRVVGVEALARWRRRSGELVAPDRFIGLAEEIGLIEPLGERILRTACRDALAWRRSSSAPFMLSVNVSPRQFASGDLVNMVLTVLADTGFDATCLHLEITESALMNEPSVRTTMGELRKHGIKFAIDDFGTGYSSLASLRELPVDILKIDRSFVSGLTTNTQDRALITAAIDLARSFGLTTIVEGVETQEQLRELTVLGCDLAQGYLWSRPVEAKKVAGVMEDVDKITHDRLVLAHH